MPLPAKDGQAQSGYYTLVDGSSLMGNVVADVLIGKKCSPWLIFFLSLTTEDTEYTEGILG